MRIKAGITISRPQYSDGRKQIEIYLYDNEACIRFAEVYVSFESFVEALTGLSQSNCEATLFGLQNVGKKYEYDTITFKVSDDPCYGNERRAQAKKEAEKHIPDGWKLSDSFSSQGSFFYKDNETWARANIVRWVNKEDKHA